MLRVLVVAPRFPAINQPWIDTYLEQLLNSGSDFRIYTENAGNLFYGSKVEDLGLRRKILDFSVRAPSIGAGIIRQLKRNPYRLYRASRQACFLYQESRAIGVPSLSILKRLLALIANLDKFEDFDCVHSHTEILGFDFLLLARLLGLPFVLTFHGLPPAGLGQLKEAQRKFLYLNTRIVFVNTRFASDQVKNLGARELSVCILPQGLPLPEFPFSPRAKIEGVVKVLTVGRFHRDKGQSYALLALRRLTLRGRSIHWTFVGVGPDEKRLRKIALKLGILEKINFFGGASSDELQKLYASSDFFVLPSVHNPNGHVETQGVVLQEAQATGCVPIASRTGGIPECVTDMYDSVLVRPRSSREIADAVEFLLDHPEKTQHLRLKGRENVETRFSSDLIGVQLHKQLTDLVFSRR